MKIDYQVIPHVEQRYETPGDYWQDGDVWHFRVSALSDRRYEWLIFLHELIEWVLVLLAGVAVEEIDAFDRAYEGLRPTGVAPCGCKIAEEPGFDRHAPYHHQHYLADICERAIGFALKVDWNAYADEVEAL